jgi:hypothetical protein
MSPTRLGYKELGLKLVSLEEKISHTPKQPSMAGEKKDDRTKYPFKLLLEEALVRQRNKMMNNFVQILRWLPTSDAYSSSRGSTHFKVHINVMIQNSQNVVMYLVTSDNTNMEKQQFSNLEGLFKVLLQ